jgi:hypothetical protein
MAEIKREIYQPNDWNKPVDLADFFQLYQSWHFDWLDVAQIIRDTDQILKYPMVDTDPVERWWIIPRLTSATDRPAGSRVAKPQ